MTKLISSVAQRADELHPMAAKVARASARQKPLCECTAKEAREIRESLGNPFAPPRCEMESINDYWLPSSGGHQLKVRRYQPKSLSAGLQPALLFFSWWWTCFGHTGWVRHTRPAVGAIG